MKIDFQKFTSLLLEAPEFSRQHEKDEKKLQKKIFGELLSAGSMKDIEHITDKQLEETVRHVKSFFGETGPEEIQKEGLIKSIIKKPLMITDRII